MNNHISDSELIDAYGGTSKVAALCGITTSAVSQWRNNGIPKAWKKVLRLEKPKVFRTWAEKNRRKEASHA